MSTTLPAPIAHFLQAMNAHDTDALLASLTADAVVADDGQEHRGHDQIKTWSDQIIRDFQLSLEVDNVTQQDDEIVVSTRVSGTFEGSPLPFRYHFILAGDRITAVRIEAGP